MKMKTLSINHMKFRLYDEGAVRYDTQQALPEQMQQQARDNIGVSNGGASLTSQIVDHVLVVSLIGNLAASIQDGVLVVG